MQLADHIRKARQIQFKNFAVRGRAYKELVGSLT